MARTVPQHSKDGNNILYLLIPQCRQSQLPYLQIVVESASAESLSEAIVQCHKRDGNNPLHRVEHFMHGLTQLPPDMNSLFMLMEKVSSAALGRAFLQKNFKRRRPILSFISTHKKTLQRLLKCFTEEDLLEILLLPRDERVENVETNFEAIIFHYYTNNIEELFTKAQINEVCERMQDTLCFSLICGVIYRKQFDLAASIIQALKVETLSKFLQQASNKHYKKTFINFLRSMDDLSLIEHVCKAAPEICFEFYSEYWIEGLKLIHTIGAIFEKYVNEKKDLNSIESAYIQFTRRDDKESTYSSVKNGKSEVINIYNIDPCEVAKNIFENGLESYVDLHILNAFIHNRTKNSNYFFDRAVIIDVLRKDNAIFSGADIAYCEFLDFPGVREQMNVFVDIYNCIHHQRALIKIIKEPHSDDFIKQLSDYSYRPSLRISEIKEEECTHKYLHNEDKIIPYDSHKNVKNKVYRSLKKQSFSILGRQLKIPVFGEHDQSRMLVGLMFNRQQCLPAKAFFRHDYGTVSRKWVGTEEAVSQYAEKVKNVRLNNWDELIEHIEKNPTQMPEILARVTRESAKTVVIARDTPDARRYARELQNKIQRIGLTIAIIFYHRKTQYISLYTEQSLLASATTSLKGSANVESQLQRVSLFANTNALSNPVNPTSSSSKARLAS